MAGKPLMREPQDPAKSQGGRPSRWPGQGKLPLAGALAASMLIGAAMLSLPVGPAETENLSLYRKGRIGKGRLTLEEKISVWQHELGFAKGCDPAKFRGVLEEIRAEQGRLMQAGDMAHLGRLLDLERAAAEIYASDLRDPSCRKSKD
jgi:hypothetical protein